MRVKLHLLIFLFLPFGAFSQVEDALVFFADKENVTAALANPISILSQEAIDRKMLHGTPIDERDVPLNEEYKNIVSNQLGITVLAKSKWMNAIYVQGEKSNIENLLNLDFVSEIEFMNKNFNRPVSLRIIDDKFEIEQSRIIYNYGTAQNQTEMIAVDALHNRGYNGEGIRVAFMDNGYPNVLNNPAYAELRDENRLLGSYDFVSRTTNADGSGNHGALTFSNAAAYLEGQFKGTAPKAMYYLFITEDGNQESPIEEAYWLEALERADSLGVYITNTSLGYQDFDNSAYDYSYSDLDNETTIGARAANHAFDKGMLNVVSAGNSGQTFGYVASPAHSSGALAVGAVDSNGNYASFSSFGPTYDGRIKPDIMAQGVDAATIDENGNLASANGTSLSAPIITGAIASLWSVAPELTNNQIMQIVRESAHLYNNPTEEMGYGIPDFSQALDALEQLGIEDLKQEHSFALYPNPIDTEVFISFPKDIDFATFQLYDVLGKTLLHKNISSSHNKVEVSHLKSGVYFVLLTANNTSTRFKIVKK